jgi:hypothetical protein
MQCCENWLCLHCKLVSNLLFLVHYILGAWGSGLNRVVITLCPHNGSRCSKPWYSDCSTTEGTGLLWSYTVLLGKWFLTFQRIIVPSCSGSISHSSWTLKPKDEGTMLLKDTGDYLPNDTTSHPRRRNLQVLFLKHCVPWIKIRQWKISYMYIQFRK